MINNNLIVLILYLMYSVRKSAFMPYVDYDGPDQPVNLCSLIRVFIAHCRVMDIPGMSCVRRVLQSAL